MKSKLSILNTGLLLSYLYFCYLMLTITLQYLPFDMDVAFLRIKQDDMQYFYYPWAFFIHVYTSIFVLMAGFTQFSKRLQRKFPAVHRISGWIYAVVIIVLAGPSGLVMGVHANGGWSSQLAFCLLAILWIFFTAMAIFKIKKRDIIGHQQWMMRSFALTLSAITLRAWKYVLVACFQPKPMDVYRWVAWLGWLVNLIIIEIFIYHQNHKKK